MILMNRVNSREVIMYWESDIWRDWFFNYLRWLNGGGLSIWNLKGKYGMKYFKNNYF